MALLLRKDTRVHIGVRNAIVRGFKFDLADGFLCLRPMQAQPQLV